jgi:geranylgeranyl diphosphate synthase type II
MNYQEALSIVGSYIEKERLTKDPLQLYEPMDYLVQEAGKRIRPSLVLMSGSLYNGEVNHLLPAAYAVELFHNFTLMHDDIMDHAPTRRGKPTVHEKWDQSTAILSGDAMLICAYEYLMRSQPEQLDLVLSGFNRMAIDLCEGQMRDMCLTDSAASYLQMIEGKTAVLIGYCMKLGVLVAGGPEKDADILYQVGVKAGLAFQIIDDVIDAFSNNPKVGKQAHGDILEGKKTILYHRAMEAMQRGKAEFEKLYAVQDKTESQVHEVLEVFNNLDIQKQSEDVADQYLKESLSLLSQVSVRTEKLAPLKDLLQFLAKRDY